MTYRLVFCTVRAKRCTCTYKSKFRSGWEDVYNSGCGVFIAIILDPIQTVFGELWV